MEQAVRRIGEAGTIAIVLADAPGLDALGSAVALERGLQTLGKTVSVFAPFDPAQGKPPADARTPFPTQALVAAGGWSNEPLREFIISFDLTRSPIKELKYERDENRMNIILAPTGSSIRREDVEFKNGALRYDLAITLGVSRIEEASASLERAPELLHEKPVLNIDADPANTAYGELNLLAAADEPKGSPTIPESAYHILTELNALPPDPETATALLAALAAATQNLRLGRASPGALRMAGELVERGADAEAARRYSTPARPLSEQQLLARAVARTRWDPETSTFWSVLTAEDFEKTGMTGAAAGELLEQIGDTLPQAAHHVLLWQDAESAEIKSRVRPMPAEEAPLREPLALTYPTFQEAEAAIGELLRSQKGVE